MFEQLCNETQLRNILLYCCTAVLLYCCTAVLLYCCTAVLLASHQQDWQWRYVCCLPFCRYSLHKLLLTPTYCRSPLHIVVDAEKAWLLLLLLLLLQAHRSHLRMQQ
jgi:hypothetical protein